MFKLKTKRRRPPAAAGFSYNRKQDLGSNRQLQDVTSSSICHLTAGWQNVHTKQLLEVHSSSQSNAGIHRVSVHVA